MAVNLSPVGGVAGQFFDNNGDPLVGGKLYTYAAGTTTPQATYTSSSGATANSNPIILNAGGRVPAEIWLTDGLVYKFVLYSSTDQLIGSWDNIVGINSNFVNFVTSEEVQTATAGQTVFTLTTMSYQPGINNLVVYVDGVNQVEGGAYSYVETNSTTVTFTSGLHLGAVVKFVSAETVTTIGSNAAVVAYEPAGSGAVTTTVQAKLRETVSVKDFGAVGDGVTDDTAAIQAALDSGARQIYIPQGYYKVSSTLTVPTTVSVIYGAGINASRLWSNTATANYLIDVTAASVSMRDFRLYGGDQETSALSAPTDRNGINATGTGNQFAWERLAVYGFDIGASVGSLGATVYMLLFSHLDFALCNSGMIVDQGMNQSTWLNCQFRACVNNGLRFDPTTTSSESVANGIYNCTFERTSSGTGAGLWVENIRGLDISACYFEGNKNNSLYIVGSSSNGTQAISVHNCYFFEFSSFYSPAAGGHGIQVVGSFVDGISITNNHFEDYNSATFYPIRLVGYSGDTAFLQNNVFNNCTYKIQSDYAYQLNDFGGINNHVIVRQQGLTDGSGNLSTLTLGELALGNATADLFLQVTMVRCTDDMLAVDATTVVRMRAFVSGSTVSLTVGSGAPTGVTFSVGSTTALVNSFIAPLQVAISGGDVDTNIGFIVEIAVANNARLGGLSTIDKTFS